MTEADMNTGEVRTEIDEQLEPIVIARVSEVTGTAPGGEEDPEDNVVWGNK